MTSFKTSTLPNDLQSSLSSNKGKLSDLEDMNERRLMKDAFGDYFKLPEVTSFAET